MLMNILNSAIVYLFIIVGIRLLGKKELGQLSVADLIFIMLISEVVGEAMIAADNSLLGCLVAAATLMILNKIIKALAFRYKKFSEILEGRPAILIRHGKSITKK